MSSPSNETEYQESEPRRDVHIDSEKYEMFNEMQESKDSPLYQAENHNLFMISVGYGRKQAMPKPIENEEHAFFGRSRLSDSQQAVLEAVAIREERDVHVLKDQRKVYEIAEEYANAGVEELHGRIFGPKDDPLSELTLEIRDAYSKTAEK